jgi:hypothetical protein
LWTRKCKAIYLERLTQLAEQLELWTRQLEGIWLRELTKPSEWQVALWTSQLGRYLPGETDDFVRISGTGVKTTTYFTQWG